ncbi:UNVERIFIED_CONTAM: hypothetical protein GTU68_064857 [Idotea baltica]|nr:hypothetical protein [Idotea baltica]
MFNRIIYFSIHNKLIVATFLMVVIGWGIYNLSHLSLDAVPDITDNQVQVITSTPDLSAQEVERLITYPLEMEMGNIPDVAEIRSISRFGLSVITIVFLEHVDIYWAREQISQKLQSARNRIPTSIGNPEMGPISTGLGEIYQYVIYPADGYEDQFDPTELRTIQDWIIRRQLIGTEGVVEVNSSGGYLKQYEIALDQNKLKAFGISLSEIYEAVESSNANAGGSYIERDDHTFFIRGEGTAKNIADLEDIVVKHSGLAPILVKNLATVRVGAAPRFGAVTMNGKGEVVAGQVMMLKGENSMEVTKRVKARIEEIKLTLPEGLILEPYLDRSKLVNRTTETISKNLIEGALIVVFILVLLLGNLRAGLIVASVIPISMLFAVSFMRLFGVSANLMSLGALDFGLIVDGAVIIVESILHHLGVKNKKGNLSDEEKTHEVYAAASKIRKSASFGEIIILMVYLPIFFLQGVEGKMFIPMAQTVSFAILGALILSLTYVPMMSDLFLKDSVVRESSISDQIMSSIYRLYAPLREWSFRMKYFVLVLVSAIFIGALILLSRMGSEFIPTLEEGDFALHQILPAGSSIKKGVEVSAKLQDILMSKFPEIEQVVTKIGTAEIPTDIMPIEAGDVYVIMKPKSEWRSASSREEMFDLMEEELSKFPGVIYEFTQPIQMRFNELMTGVRQDIAIKIYGEDLGVLVDRAHAAESLLKNLQGVGDIKVEATAGLQQMVVDYDMSRMAKYGVTVRQLNDILQASFAGKVAGRFYEGERQFDIVLRLREDQRQSIESLKDLHVNLPGGHFVPMSELARIEFREGPTQISRDDTKRRITLGVNARNMDIATLMESVQTRLKEELDLPTGYYITYGGQFENLERAKKRLGLVVPAALFIILLLLYFTFHSLSYALLIFIAIPLSAIGGILALYIRDMPFSISAAVGFIALFGVAVLNGIVLVSYFNQLKSEGMTDLRKIIEEGTRVRLRPVVMTALVASLGFLPMALSGSAGAEVQQPLATVVIGGLMSATFLTLIIIPILYFLLEVRNSQRRKVLLPIILCLGMTPALFAQQTLEIDRLGELLEEKGSLLRESAGLRQEGLIQGAQRPFGPNQTFISISGEEFNFEGAVGIQSLNLGQNFRLGRPAKAYGVLAQSQAAQVENDLLIRDRLFYRKVTDVYLEAAAVSSLIGVEIDQLEALQEYLRIAERQKEVGEKGGLQVRQIEQMLKLSKIRLSGLEGAQKSYLEMLGNWLGDEVLEVSTLQDLDPQFSLSEERESLTLRSFEIEKDQLVGQRDVALANIAPQLMTQLRLQSVSGSFLFYGYQLGIGIPIGKGYKEQKNIALQLASSSIDKHSEWVGDQIDIDRSRIRNEISTSRIMVAEMETQIEMQRELLTDMRRAFRFGEATYAEVMMAYQIFYELRVQHASRLKALYFNMNELQYYVYQ